MKKALAGPERSYLRDTGTGFYVRRLSIGRYMLPGSGEDTGLTPERPTMLAEL